MNKKLSSIVTAAGIVIGSSAYLHGCYNNPIQAGGDVSDRRKQADCEFDETAQILSCYEGLIAYTKRCADNLRVPSGAHDKDLNARCADVDPDKELESCQQNAHNRHQQCVRGEQK